MLPVVFPLWRQIEQAACVLLRLAVVAIANGRRLRSTVAAE